MTYAPSPSGELILGHVLASAGIKDLQEVLIVRHTYREDGIATPRDATPEKLFEYTSEQDVRTLKFPKEPPKHWLVFMADGKRRSRLIAVYENHGELRRTVSSRFFDLRESELLGALRGRLVIEWSKDPINYAKNAMKAALMPVLEIADPELEPFPGFDRVLLTYGELQRMVEDSRYTHWVTALSAVQGIYLIADSTDGQLYVGKADGNERIYGRWSAYARDGHGGNVALKELAGLDPTHRAQFVFSILRVFGPEATREEIDAAESHYKDALLSRKHGHNRN